MAHEPRSEAPAAPGVSFELERFEWVAGDRLELVGRWSGLRGHRFLRPTLDVEVDGERRRMLAILEHKPWAPEEGEDWIAAFTWRGDPAKFEEAELTVSPELAVALPPAGGTAAPGKGRSRKAAPAADPRPARRPRTAVLEEELGSALAEAQELREQLTAEQTNLKGLETQLRQAREELAAAQAAAKELDAVRQERDEAAEARDEAEAARNAAREKADQAWTAAKKALGEAEHAHRERDAAREQMAAAEGERAALAEARDRAREERNAWMQRARAAAAGRPSATPPVSEPPTQAHPAPAADRSEPPTDQHPARGADQPEPATQPRPAPVPDLPEPASAARREPPPAPPAESATERRTIRIGERPAPARPHPSPMMGLPRWRVFLDAWGPRLVALLALVVLALIVLVLLAWAL